MEQTPGVHDPATEAGGTPLPPDGAPPAPVAVTAWLAYLGAAALMVLVVGGAVGWKRDAGTFGLVVGGVLLLFVLFFAMVFYLAGRSLVKWGNVQGVRILAVIPFLVGGLGVFNGVQRVSTDTVGLLIGFVVMLAYSVLLFVLPGQGAGRAWLAARQQWAAAERQRRMAEVARRFGG